LDPHPDYTNYLGQPIQALPYYTFVVSDILVRHRRHITNSLAFYLPIT